MGVGVGVGVGVSVGVGVGVYKGLSRAINYPQTKYPRMCL